MDEQKQKKTLDCEGRDESAMPLLAPVALQLCKHRKIPTYKRGPSPSKGPRPFRF